LLLVWETKFHLLILKKACVLGMFSSYSGYCHINIASEQYLFFLFLFICVLKLFDLHFLISTVDSNKYQIQILLPPKIRVDRDSDSIARAEHKFNCK
jgi:hypothetical protein